MKAKPTDDTMPSIAEQIHGVVDEMLEPFGKTSPRGSGLLTLFAPPIDISKPNQHDTKADFLRERRTIDRSISHIDGLIEALLPDDAEPAKGAMLEALAERLDRKHLEKAATIEIGDAMSLVRKTIAMVGGSHAFLWMLSEQRQVLTERGKELREQEQRFWNLAHRAPDYYAREIALRLARLFARETGQRPTVGTSPHDGSPSTAYARALAKVFSILEITANQRGPAEWAASEITDDDLQPPIRSLVNAFGFGSPLKQPLTSEAMVAALQEESGAS